MRTSFKVGDRVEVTGELAKLFGESGTVLEVVMVRPNEPDYTVYRIAFNDKHVRMIGLYLRSAAAPAKTPQVCPSR